MKFAKNIFPSFQKLVLLATGLNRTKLVLISVLISGCASGPVTNARVCAEIPFLDGPEGACVWTVTQKTELVNAQTWASQRPLMLMIDAKSWTEIKKDWLKACRLAGSTCNVQVDSIDRVIKGLDEMVKKFPKP